MRVISQERRYFIEGLAEEFGKAYASVIGTMGGFEYRGREEKNRTSRRILGAKLEGFRMSAVLILRADDFNGVETEEQAEELIRRHRVLYREAIEKDEADKAGWV